MAVTWCSFLEKRRSSVVSEPSVAAARAPSFAGRLAGERGRE